ncbi:SET domain-containing protein, partial [Anaeromyces robustus]
NHSCSPNATLYYHGNRQILRAMRDIQKGEEICITYTDVMNSRSHRKKILLKKYKFDCHCERC